MPIEKNNEAEREARIEEMLRQIRAAQQRVQRLAAEGRRRAEQIAGARIQKGEPDTPA